MRRLGLALVFVLIVASCAAAFQFAASSYTGDGLDNRNITGVGFQPDLVVIKGAGATQGRWKPAALAGDAALFFGMLGTDADGIQALQADGFQVGLNATVNTSGTTYYWWAVRDNGTGDFTQGTYTGDGLDNRNIVISPAFQPTFVHTHGTARNNSPFRTAEMAGDASTFLTAFGNLANFIQALNVDGFQVGTSLDVNQSGTVYYYFAFKNVTGAFKTGTYTGDGLDNRSITGIGFQPQVIWTKVFDATSEFAHRYNSQVGDLSFVGTAAAEAANQVQAFEADGFQVGTSAGTNANTKTYHWVAIRAPAVVAARRPIEPMIWE